MIDFIVTNINLYTKFIESLSNNNDMIAAVLTLSVTGVLMFLCKNIPSSIYKVLKRQLMTSITISNSRSRYHEADLAYDRLSSFIVKESSEVGSRSLEAFGEYRRDGVRLYSVAGYGVHVFIYKRNIIWAEKQRVDSSGSDKQKVEITLYKLGRSHELFNNLLEELSVKESSDKIQIYNFKSYEWDTSTSILKAPIKNLALNSNTKEVIQDSIGAFKGGREMYNKLGIPYKITCILHGEPGNGKTSLIRSVASDYNMDIYNINLSNMSDDKLNKSLGLVPPNSIVVIEDFDSAGATHKRSKVTGDIGDTGDKEEDGFRLLTLSGVLNALDGIASLDDIIIFLTTNCIDKIDSALLRAGRVDMLVELPKIEAKYVKEHLEGIYGTLPNDVKLKDMYAKEINSIKFKSKLNKELLIKNLKGNNND